MNTQRQKEWKALFTGWDVTVHAELGFIELSQDVQTSHRSPVFVQVISGKGAWVYQDDLQPKQFLVKELWDRLHHSPDRPYGWPYGEFSDVPIVKEARDGEWVITTFGKDLFPPDALKEIVCGLKKGTLMAHVTNIG